MRTAVHGPPAFICRTIYALAGDFYTVTEMRKIAFENRRTMNVLAVVVTLFIVASLLWGVVLSAKQDVKVVDSPVSPERFEKCHTCGLAKEKTSCGGVVVCFGCRKVYVKEPVNGIWHADFCPRCANEGDKRWNDEEKHLWEHYNLILQKDVSQKDEWEAL